MDLRWSFIVPQTHGVDVPAETTPSVSERPRKKSRLQTPNERKGTYEKRSNHCCLVTDSCRSSFSTMGRIRSHLSSNCRDPLFYEHTRNFNGTKGTSAITSDAHTEEKFTRRSAGIGLSGVTMTQQKLHFRMMSLFSVNKSTTSLVIVSGV